MSASEILGCDSLTVPQDWLARVLRDSVDLEYEAMAIEIPFHLDDDLKPVAAAGSENKVIIALLVQLGRDMRELATALGKPVDQTNASAAVTIVQPEPRAT